MGGTAGSASARSGHRPSRPAGPTAHPDGSPSGPGTIVPRPTRRRPRADSGSSRRSDREAGTSVGRPSLTDGGGCSGSHQGLHHARLPSPPPRDQVHAGCSAQHAPLLIDDPGRHADDPEAGRPASGGGEAGQQPADRLAARARTWPGAAAGRRQAGTTVLDGDTAFVDRLHELVGGVVTVFRGTTRVATNVRTAEGARATGTRLAPGPAGRSARSRTPPPRRWWRSGTSPNAWRR